MLPFQYFEKSVRDEILLILVAACIAFGVFLGGVVMAICKLDLAQAVLVGGVSSVSGVIGLIGGYIKGTQDSGKVNIGDQSSTVEAPKEG